MRVLLHHISGETEECVAEDYIEAREITAIICSEKKWNVKDCWCEVEGRIFHNGNEVKVDNIPVDIKNVKVSN